MPLTEQGARYAGFMRAVGREEQNRQPGMQTQSMQPATESGHLAVHIDRGKAPQQARGSFNTRRIRSFEPLEC